MVHGLLTSDELTRGEWRSLLFCSRQNAELIMGSFYDL